jgi:hypothetical protein
MEAFILEHIIFSSFLLLAFTTHLRVLASSFLRFRGHTHWNVTGGRTALDEWSARRRDLYLTHTTLITDKHPCPRGNSNPQSQQAIYIYIALERPRISWLKCRWYGSFHIRTYIKYKVVCFSEHLFKQSAATYMHLMPCKLIKFRNKFSAPVTLFVTVSWPWHL